MELNRVDLGLLKALQADSRLSSSELAEIVGISPTACQRRLRKLRKAGAIQAEVTIVSPEAVGRPLLMLVSVRLERERADIIDRFKSAIRRASEIMSGYYVTGEADFVLIVSAKSMEDFESWSRRFFYENADVKGFQTMVVMDRVKASFALPIDAD
jgi:Lrp/AsnC family leucine-responsive transcriptional regulator